jgi:hypothetical protein
MAGGSWDIPDLEALLRSVLRKALAAELGDSWIDSLPPDVRKLVHDSAKLASRKRPDEVLQDDWDAAGMPAVRAVLKWKLPKALTSVWADPNYAEVDLSRLVTARDKRAHVVGPPLGEIVESEVAAMAGRLRIGLEDVRRRLDDALGDWWPYLASVHSNVDALCWERSSGWTNGTTVVNEGDLVTFEVVGVNPNGPVEDLRFDYRILLGGGVQECSAWDESTSFSFEVPHSRSLLVRLSVGTAHDIANVDTIKRELQIRPRP